MVVSAVNKPVLFYWVCVMCKPRLKCSIGSLARLSTLLYLVEYSLYPISMIEIVPKFWPAAQGHCSSLNFSHVV